MDAKWESLIQPTTATKAPAAKANKDRRKTPNLTGKQQQNVRERT